MPGGRSARSGRELEACHEKTIGIPANTEIIGLLVPARAFSEEAALELEVLTAEAADIVEMLETELASFD